MSDESATTAAAPAAEAIPTTGTTEDAPAATAAAATGKDAAAAPADAGADEAPAEKSAKNESDKSADAAPAKPAGKADADVKKGGDDDDADNAAAPAADEAAEAAQGDDDNKDAAAAADAAAGTAAADAPATPADKSKARRKSSSGAAAGGADAGKAKKLNRKGSKARITHIDAQPGDHFYVKLKGYPRWPVIVCDEDMLPQSLLASRPVTAKRADGTYREDFADGAKRAGERTFPVMYLHTNEFGWVPNFELHELDPTTAMDVNKEKMRKDLLAAHELASESHSLSFYKDVLQKYQDELLEQQKAKEAKAASTPAKKKKQALAPEADEDGDLEMEDVADEEAEEAEEAEPKEKKSSKKRKAEENIETPARSESVKKPKIKLTTNSTPKAAANGATATPKSAKQQGEAKKSKAKKTEKAEKAEKAEKVEEKKVEKEPATPKEPELSPEEKHARKEKEVLFLRHKLQKGFITRDQEPKEEEMKMMSDYITKLESFTDLEVSIIRATKINKVMKAILKLDNIPKEPEFQFKSRSQVLLDKWNKLLADGGVAGESVNGSGEAPKSEAKANGVKDHGKAADSAKEKTKEKESAVKDEEEAAEKKTTEAST